MMHPPDSLQLRAALSRFATGVAVASTADFGEPVGLTINSFASVSLNPPLILWSLDLRSKWLGAFERASHFAINVLAVDQLALAQRFALPDNHKFATLNAADWGLGLEDVPLLVGCCATFECRVALTHDGGDHRIFIGQIERYSNSAKLPLLYFASGYRRLALGD